MVIGGLLITTCLVLVIIAVWPSELESWRSAQSGAEHFAENLLDPAPQLVPSCGPLPATYPSDGFGRGGAGAPGRLGWLDGHVPGWLPDGFGLVRWQNWKVSLGEWRGEGCGQVRLVLFEGNPNNPRWPRVLPVDDRVGDWALTEQSCSDPGSRPCLLYLAWSPEERGANENEVLGLYLQVRGIDRDEADRIATAIPV